MKRKYKIIIIISAVVLALAAIGLTLWLVLRDNKSYEETVGEMPNVEQIFEFRDKDLEIELFKEQTANLNTNISDISELKFSLEDGNIADIESNGKFVYIKGKNIGKTNLIATLGETTATCAISVDFVGNVPVVKYSIEEKDTYTIGLNNELELSQYVLYNKQKYNDIVCEYQSANESVCQITSDGKIKAVGKGETTVNIKYSWKGFELSAFTQDLTIKVIDNVSVILYGAYNGAGTPEEVSDSITLYTVNSDVSDFDSFNRSVQLSEDILLNGSSISDTVTYSLLEGGSEFVDFTSGNTLTAKKAGKAKVKMEVAAKGISKIIDVNVDKATVNAYKIFDFSTFTGEINVKNIFGKDTTITEAYQGDRKLTVKDNKIFGLVQSEKNKVTREKVTVFDNEVGYTIDLNVYLAKITNESELVSFFNNMIDKDTIAKKNTIIQGYVEVTKDLDLAAYADINASITVNGKGYGISNVYFTGVFNGNGHTIKNMKIKQSYGLFGWLSNATIKNVAFKDVQFTGDTYQCVIGRSVADYASCTISDVYISIQDFNFEYRSGSYKNGVSALISYAPGQGALNGLILRNLLVEFPEIDETTYADKRFGTLFGTAGKCMVGTAENVYVISKTVALLKSDSGELKTRYVSLAKNDANIALYQDWGTDIISDLKRPYKVVYDGVSLKAEGKESLGTVLRYNDYAAMKADTELDFSSFGKYWKDDNGALTWIGYQEEVYVPSTGDDAWHNNWQPDDNKYGNN